MSETGQFTERKEINHSAEFDKMSDVELVQFLEHEAQALLLSDQNGGRNDRDGDDFPRTSERIRPKIIGAEFNGSLTTAANNQAMKSRDDMSAVVEGLQKEQGLLAAFLEATYKVDWRAFHKPVPIRETPKLSDFESSFVPQRANLVQASDRSLVPEELQRDEG